MTDRRLRRRTMKSLLTANRAKAYTVTTRSLVSPSVPLLASRASPCPPTHSRPRARVLRLGQTAMQ